MVSKSEYITIGDMTQYSIRLDCIEKIEIHKCFDDILCKFIRVWFKNIDEKEKKHAGKLLMYTKIDDENKEDLEKPKNTDQNSKRYLDIEYSISINADFFMKQWKKRTKKLKK